MAEIQGIKLPNGTLLPYRTFCKARYDDGTLLANAMAAVKAKKAALPKPAVKAAVAPAGETWFKAVAETAIPIGTRIDAHAAIADCLAERNHKCYIGDLTLSWLLPEDREDLYDRHDYASKGLDVPWPAYLWESDMKGFYDPTPSHKRTIFLRGDLEGEADIRYTAAHEVFHAWDFLAYPGDVRDTIKRARMEREADEYGKMYVSAWRNGQRWAKEYGE